MTNFNFDFPFGIMFHHFHDDKKHPRGQGSISGEELKDMILWLKEKYNLLRAEEWYEKFIHSTLKEKDICLTFDDNLLCQYEVAVPVLKEYDLTSFWFIYTSPLEGKIENIELYRYFRSVNYSGTDDFYADFYRQIKKSKYQKEVNDHLKNFDPEIYLKEYPIYSQSDKKFRFTRDRILGPKKYFSIMDKMIEESSIEVKKVAKNLWMNKEHLSNLYAKGHILGLHSHNHPTNLANLSPPDQKEEYQRNKVILESITEKPVKTMAHPVNSYEENTLKILKDMGIKLGFRSNMNSGYISSFELPRYDHAYILKEIKIPK